MATSAISTTSSGYQPLSQQPDFRQEFRQLVSSIKSGDLSGAQQAYAALSQLQGDGQGVAANSNTPIAQALTQIGQSLQKGDIAGAQQTLAALGQQANGAHHGHHHHHGGAATESASSSSTDPGSSDSANAINIVV